jgi:hypothetical protein
MERQVNPPGETPPVTRKDRIVMVALWSLSLVWTPLLLLGLWLSGVWP